MTCIIILKNPAVFTCCVPAELKIYIWKYNIKKYDCMESDESVALNFEEVKTFCR